MIESAREPAADRAVDPAVESTSPRPRRLRRPSWLDPRALTGLALIVGSMLVGARALAAADHRSAVIAVRTSVQAGTVLRAEDVTTVRVQLPVSARGRYVAQLRDAVGQQVNQPLEAGELLPSAALAMPSPSTTVVLALGDGAAPPLRAGERIEVWAAMHGCAATVLLDDAVVQDVRADQGQFGSGGGSEVVVMLDPDAAERVARTVALDGVALRVGIVAGPPRTEATDAQPATCATPTQ
jgi:hypothetical protein